MKPLGGLPRFLTADACPSIDVSKLKTQDDGEGSWRKKKGEVLEAGDG